VKLTAKTHRLALLSAAKRAAYCRAATLLKRTAYCCDYIATPQKYSIYCDSKVQFGRDAIQARRNLGRKVSPNLPGL
ncbi:hypothetical protein, partial [Methanosarcina sp. 2.H.T.1A.15]|uniref:hypothetical protein n=1 Tax=Methanosarcina sp. 2.H.T.1A.15 TaxID=1483596 RepID=UPI001F179B89